MTKNNAFLTIAVLIILAIVAVVLLNQGVDKVDSNPTSEDTTQIAPNEPASAETDATLIIQEDEVEEASLEVEAPEASIPASETE